MTDKSSGHMLKRVIVYGQVEKDSDESDSEFYVVQTNDEGEPVAEQA